MPPDAPFRMRSYAGQGGSQHHDLALAQVAFLQRKGRPFHSRVEHGMTHSVYIADPDGHGIEVLYELPHEVWEGDIASALVWSRRLPTEGPAALQYSTDYRFFSRDEADEA